MPWASGSTRRRRSSPRIQDGGCRDRRARTPAGRARTVVAGTPTTGRLVLDDDGGRTVGVWEMSVGAMRDVEARGVHRDRGRRDRGVRAPALLADRAPSGLRRAARPGMPMDRATDAAQGVRQPVSGRVPSASVIAVARTRGTGSAKPLCDEIRLIEDAASGRRPRRGHRPAPLAVRGAWTAPNVRQVHLVRELFRELSVEGHEVAPHGGLGGTSPPRASTSSRSHVEPASASATARGQCRPPEPVRAIERFQPGLMKRLSPRRCRRRHRRGG